MSPPPSRLSQQKSGWGRGVNVDVDRDVREGPSVETTPTSRRLVGLLPAPWTGVRPRSRLARRWRIDAVGSVLYPAMRPIYLTRTAAPKLVDQPGLSSVEMWSLRRMPWRTLRASPVESHLACAPDGQGPSRIELQPPCGNSSASINISSSSSPPRFEKSSSGAPVMLGNGRLVSVSHTDSIELPGIEQERMFTSSSGRPGLGTDTMTFSQLPVSATDNAAS
ncbi:hypothetical protein BDK51DRAFT_38793 [Blyttiomyces helicus]|uniref:Uncharacterized protein n=1 Tax=Blyttiomyces helicus TaxID=388810 RepID=A0A4P9VZI7_9FUNG|nr:hypothetical protein BDK51DRAFT_38793 [Blyttiomyces helicus]|eukprot:RKO84742.1 hypothetical protein BDK51DRAFT_38793 [Blyttiomyces helicus]